MRGFGLGVFRNRTSMCVIHTNIPYICTYVSVNALSLKMYIKNIYIYISISKMFLVFSV